MPARNVTVAAVVATLAFVAYARTLLPGVDLGDTGGFQAAVGWPAVSARQAYPLYYTLAKGFLALVGGPSPARALNLFSAVCGAMAAGVLSLLVGRLTQSARAGAGAGLLLAFSYTFWSQAIIAEVYTLHLTLIGLSLLGLARVPERPTPVRLAVFFLVYAASFGNHLSMILLFVPFTLFLGLTLPTWRDLVRPSTLALALAAAAIGAAQYLPNLLEVWASPDAPADWRERLALFWFDTTKADWRETMVMGVDAGQLQERLAMWRWDARQQFGVAGLIVGAIGGIRVWWRSRAWAVLLWSAWSITTTFALTYNVGDSHVFFLPASYFLAMAAGFAVAPVSRVTVGSPAPAGTPSRIAASGKAPAAAPWRQRLGAATCVTTGVVVLLAYTGWRAWDTWPLVDRHDDRRGDALVARTAAGLDGSTAVLLSQMDWQAENALLYTSRTDRRNFVWTRLGDVLPHFPFFVDANHAIDREVVLTADAASNVVAAYGSAFGLDYVDDPALGTLPAAAARVPLGAPYVLTLLTPTSGTSLDAADLRQSLATLTGNHAPRLTGEHFQVIAGTAGERPATTASRRRPFRTTVDVAGDRFDVRFESWLPHDTFRRPGFGRVLVGRRGILIVERGASLVWLDRSGDPVVAYAAGLHAPRPRFRISRATLRMAALPGPPEP